MEYNIPNHISGDTWKGINNLTIARDGSALDLTGATVKMIVKFQIDAPPVLILGTDDNSIVITDPTNGVIAIPDRIVDVPPASYQWSFKVSLSGGEVRTFIMGSWNIISNTLK
jgi:hypothetical protein